MEDTRALVSFELTWRAAARENALRHARLNTWDDAGGWRRRATQWEAGRAALKATSTVSSLPQPSPDSITFIEGLLYAADDIRYAKSFREIARKVQRFTKHVRRYKALYA